jgi:(3R)-3-hydroxyacyl-CoA dehydrogenase / 3a,7a,12a-trihydroxy-5b-cholest-24-enoyl-CoA hydratase / enoyl-CoA hydratase 2
MTNEKHGEQIAKEATQISGPLSAVGFEFEPAIFTYTERDLSLYALSVGAAADPLDMEELTFVYELSRGGLRPLPTFAVTFPFSLLWQVTAVPGLTFNPALLLHGEQYLELKRPLPLNATVTNKARIARIYDKGSGALVLLDVNSYDESGTALAYNQVSLFIRGLGGFGGERGPSASTFEIPDRSPDAVHHERTNPNQALLYRLSSGDRNPLHADPAFAAAGGFERPILHGLCTFGFAGRAVLKQFAGNDPARFKSIRARFARHVFPGETLVTDMWAEPDGRVLFQTRVAERDEVVLTGGEAVLRHNADEKD